MPPTEWFTIDCYDTLIAFAIVPTTLEILGDRARGIDTKAFLATFSEVRKADEDLPWRSRIVSCSRAPHDGRWIGTG